MLIRFMCHPFFSFQQSSITMKQCTRDSDKDLQMFVTSINENLGKRFEWLMLFLSNRVDSGRTKFFSEELLLLLVVLQPLVLMVLLLEVEYYY